MDTYLLLLLLSLLVLFGFLHGCVVAVGNKCDREDRCVSTDEAKQLAAELNVTFVETSAKDNNNVERVRRLQWSLLSLCVSK